MTPQISFIIPAYNAQETLEAAARSVLRQQGAAFELIIVDDGSLDATKAIAQRLAAENDIVTAITQPNGGTAAALNRGRGAARGQVIAHIDADDELTEDYLVKMLQFMSSRPNYDMYTHDLWRVGVDGTKTRVFGATEIRTITLDQFLVESNVNGPGTLLRREIVDKVGGYRVGVYNEDYDFWLRALAVGARLIYYPEPLYLYHERLGQKTANRVEVYRSMIEVLENLGCSGALSETQLATVRASIPHFESDLLDLNRYGVVMDDFVAQRLHAGAGSLRGWLERVLPSSGVDGALNVIHKVTWIVRPIRVFLLRTRIRVAAALKKR